MAISYPVTPPITPGFTRIQFFVDAANALVESPWTLKPEAQRHAGQRWRASVSMPPLTREQAEPWRAFLLSLMGTYGTFYLGDPLATAPRGVATGTPLVKGASQTGNTLITDGWTNSTSGILKAGDYIQIGTQLFGVLQDANSNGSGEATLELFPRVRTAFADNAAITKTFCKGLFRLTTSQVPISEANAEGNLYTVGFDAMEAV